MERCTLTQIPCREAIMEVVQNNARTESIIAATLMNWQNFFSDTACSVMKLFMELSEGSIRVALKLITDA